MKYMNKKNIDIKEKRLSLGITVNDFSDALGFNRDEKTKLKLWELGKEDIPSNYYKQIMEFPIKRKPKDNDSEKKYTTIDLFAGIGGIRLGYEKYCRNVFSSEWDKDAAITYKVNFDEIPRGDITKIENSEIPDHDILLAGFPCQPFSQAGLQKGFEDERGMMIFEIIRIIKYKRPKAFLLENVKRLKTHNQGETLKIILKMLKELDYYIPEPQILNSYDFGIPQNRQRLFIVGFNKRLIKKNYSKFIFPMGNKKNNVKVGDILEKNVLDRYTISDKLYEGHLRRKKEHKNKGNGFGFSLVNSESKYTNTISARYYKDGSEALVEQKGKNPRLLTPRECARLQGFPDDFIIPVSNSKAYKQFGNSVCVPVIEEIALEMIEYLDSNF